MIDLKPGGRVGGRYVLVERLGGGGMGEVWLATQEGGGGFRRKVVVKCVAAEYAGDARLRAMLRDEARILGLLHHPNIVSPVDYVEGDDGPALVLEYIDGPSLRSLLRAARRARRILPEPLAAWIGAEVARALHAAHHAVDERGEPLRLVHRDVSPDNVLLSRDGRVHLADFGVARAEGNEDETVPGAPKGKRGYMPPEQAAGREVGPPADVFALGRVVAETADAGCSSLLRALLDKAVAADPRDRFQSCAALAEELTLVVPPPRDPNGLLAEWVGALVPGGRASQPPGSDGPLSPRPSYPDLRAVTNPGAGQLFASFGRGRPGWVRKVAAAGVGVVLAAILLPLAWLAAGDEGFERAAKQMSGIYSPTGTLKVRSYPEGAEVYVDGSLRGVTPLVLQVAEGKHALRVGSPKMERWHAAEVRVQVDRTTSVEVELAP